MVFLNVFVQAAFAVAMIQSSHQICVRVGEEAKVQLGDQGVGGYVWSINQLPPGLKMVGGPEQLPGKDVGSGSSLMMRFVAEMPGKYILILERLRPWGNYEPAERREVTITAS
jgi:predicted secreted protein